jgi:5-methylcytosine-specific restriction protein A
MAWPTTSRHERGYGSAWVKTRKTILERDKHLCQSCKAKGQITKATEVHHVKPKANGGTDAPDNLVSICRDCHDQETKDAKGRNGKAITGIDGWPI